ncbi:MAG: hypothetical protein AB7U23_13190 [Dehalococcoidia bacterium]
MAYATLADVRAEGLTVSDASDARVTALLSEASATIDQVTGQVFTRSTGTKRVVGRGSRYLWLPLPVSSVTEIRHVEKGTGSETIIPPTSYDVGVEAGNPKIERLDAKWCDGAIYEVDGAWGRVGSDGATPADITRATLLLVIHWAGTLMDPDANAFRRQVDLRSVTTRGRSESYGGRPSDSTLTGVPDVDLIIARYRAPIEVWAA